MRPGFHRRDVGLAAGLLCAAMALGCAASSTPAAEGARHPAGSQALADDSVERAIVPIRRVSIDHGRMEHGGRPRSESQLLAPTEAAPREPGHVDPPLAVRAAAVCVDPSVEPRQPTCRFDANQSVRAVKLTRSKLKGSLRWCAGLEPMPWVSSTRAAKLNVPYGELGLPNQTEVQRPGTGTVLGTTIDHHWAIATVLDTPILFTTNGSAVPLRLPDGSPAHELSEGGVYPPSKGAMLRFPDGRGSIYRIEAEGTAVPIAPPTPQSQYVGWASNGGGQDSLWRWSTRSDGDRGTETEVWAIVHHRADGTIAGAPETFPAPSFCSDLDVDDDALANAPRFGLDRVAPDNVRHGGHAGRGMRIVQLGEQLCLDRARGLEDQRYWRPSTDRPGGAERVTCSSWRLDAEPRATLRTSAAESASRDAGGAMSLR